MATRLLRRVAAIAAFALLLAAVPAAQDPPAGVKIGPRDQVTVTVLNSPAYSGKYTVDPSGMIDYAPLGVRVQAAGLTTSDLAAAIKKELATQVFRDPQVSVDLDLTAQMHVTVMGAVSNPSEVPFTGELRLFTALARAGSTTADASDEAIVVRAGANGTGSGGEGRIKVDLSALLTGDMTGNVALHDGDMVIVGKAEPFFVNGYVNHPGQFPFKKGMTVERAITMAGGFAEQARRNKFTIRRVVNGKAKDLKNVGLAEPVQAGDIIKVDRSIL